MVADRTTDESRTVPLGRGRRGGSFVVRCTGVAGRRRLDPWAPGVGLTAMRDRVEAVGGTLAADAGPGGGVVEARLPLTAAGAG
jgi:signal transduction histidine kinase